MTVVEGDFGFAKIEWSKWQELLRHMQNLVSDAASYQKDIAALKTENAALKRQVNEQDAIIANFEEQKEEMLADAALADQRLGTLRHHYENADDFAQNPVMLPDPGEGASDFCLGHEVSLTPNDLRLDAWAESLNLAIKHMQKAGINGINLMPLQDLRRTLLDLEPQEIGKLMRLLFEGGWRRANRIALMSAEEAAVAEIKIAERWNSSAAGESKYRGYKELAQARNDGASAKDIENDVRISCEMRSGGVKPRPRQTPETAEEKARKAKELAMFKGLFEANREAAELLMPSGGEEALQQFIGHKAKYAIPKKPGKTG